MPVQTDYLIPNITRHAGPTRADRRGSIGRRRQRAKGVGIRPGEDYKMNGPDTQCSGRSAFPGQVFRDGTSCVPSKRTRGAHDVRAGVTRLRAGRPIGKNPAMDAALDPSPQDRTKVVEVRYWAAARAAAGVGGDAIEVDGPITLEEVVARASALHGGTTLPRVLTACSVLVGDQPVSSKDPAQVVVQPGSTVEFLPPFAGG